MKCNKTVLITTIAAAITFSQTIKADDGRDYEKELQDNLRHEKAMEAAKEKEAMRDKSHDNRVKVDKNTSIGISDETVNVRATK